MVGCLQFDPTILQVRPDSYIDSRYTRDILGLNSGYTQNNLQWAID